MNACPGFWISLSYQVGYYPDKARDWVLDVAELVRSYQAAKKKSDIKAIVVINPGNPTTQVLTRENLKAVIKFAAEKKLFVFADKVISCNIHSSLPRFFLFFFGRCTSRMFMLMGQPYTTSRRS